MSDYQLAVILFNLYLAVLNKNKPVFIAIMTALLGAKLVLLHFK
jgi:RsiW-degrading membrane proteinase PrsW (M82 family)